MYFPYQKGRYEVAPGLLPLSHDFGNGPLDQRLFQIGPDFNEFRTQFEANRKSESVARYVCLSKDADQSSLGKITRFMAEKLAAEYPESFFVSHPEADQTEIRSSLTSESFLFNDQNKILELKSAFSFENAWDALGAQVPEDLAIWKLNDDGSEEIEALHLNAPNHWAAQDKIGKSFAVVHHPVAHIEKIVPWAVTILEGIIKKGPVVRFAWGVGTDDRLNHHPEAAPGRSFNAKEPKLYARVERQVLLGFPELNRALFTIRTYFQDVRDLQKHHPEALKGLKEAILSMSEASLTYKGMTADRDAIASFLSDLIQESHQ